MGPSFWSKRGYSDFQLGWYQEESAVAYDGSPYEKDFNELNPKMARKYMQLSFSYSFQADNDEVFCAYTVPYSYSSMQAHIKQLQILSKANGKSLTSI
jgi:hypothetical protein